MQFQDSFTLYLLVSIFMSNNDTVKSVQIAIQLKTINSFHGKKTTEQ